MQALLRHPSTFQTILLINDNKTSHLSSLAALALTLAHCGNTEVSLATAAHHQFNGFEWFMCGHTKKASNMPSLKHVFSSVEQLLSLFNLPAIVLYLYIMVVSSVTFGSGSASHLGMRGSGFDPQMGHTKDCKNGKHCLPAWNSASGVDLVTFVHSVIPAAAQRPLR